jgi:hypothetical protein
MAITAVNRGDLVIVHNTSLGVHGMFLVDNVAGDAVRIADVGDADVRAGGDKSRFATVSLSQDILADIPAGSISA